MTPEILERLKRSVIEGDKAGAKKAAEDALQAGISFTTALNEGLARGMEVVGDRFQRCEIFLPDMMMAADAMKEATDILKASTGSEEARRARRGIVVLGTVQGDIHDIGKEIVSALLQASSFEVHDLGTEVPPLDFVERAKQVGADIIALSCLMAPSRGYQRDVIKILRDMGIRDDYWVMVGGGTVTAEWAKEIGADGYGRFADHAVQVANLLMGEGKGEEAVVVRQ